MPAFAAAPPYDTAGGEWRTYGGNLGSWRYSALDQITADNFKNLRNSWTFLPDNLGPVPDPNLQATPLMVKGTPTRPSTMSSVPWASTRFCQITASPLAV